MHILCRLNLSGKGITLCELTINAKFHDIKSEEDNKRSFNFNILAENANKIENKEP